MALEKDRLLLNNVKVDLYLSIGDKVSIELDADMERYGLSMLLFHDIILGIYERCAD